MQENQLQTVNVNNFDDSEDEIDLVDLFFMLWSKLKWIILMGIIGGLVAAGITYYLIPKKYEAVSKIYIVSTSNDSVINLSDLQLGTSLTQDYKELLLSRPMLESIQNNLKLDMELSDLEKSITLENPSSTRILNITVKTTDPKLSADIANEMATLSKTWLSEIMESRQPNIIQRAVVPEKKCSPSMVKNTVIGGFALAFLYVAVLVVKYMMDDTIHSGDDMEKYFGIVPMAVVPEVSGLVDDKGNSSKAQKKKGGKR